MSESFRNPCPNKAAKQDCPSDILRQCPVRNPPVKEPCPNRHHNCTSAFYLFWPLESDQERKAHTKKTQVSLKSFSFALASSTPPVSVMRSDEIGRRLTRQELQQVQ
ncbi:unnamed protein product [Polarella glacialis]|uniref:Uncharacterized protein n=1 Tax=Polarella glacialis TaxID=89957 RepID=A0A813FDE4_POLGL|nr:unnamed protein product [Polarella glacialis]